LNNGKSQKKGNMKREGDKAEGNVMVPPKEGALSGGPIKKRSSAQIRVGGGDHEGGNG